MHKTPYYLIDLEKLNRNLHSMQDSFSKYWPNFRISYSFKTNNLPWLVSWFKAQNIYAEIVSTPEYDLAKYVGYTDKNIILNGPNKGKNTILTIINKDGIVNLDSFEEINFLIENKNKIAANAKIGIRINFDLEKYCPNETIPGKEPGRFGFNYENGDFKKAINLIHTNTHIKIVGIHGHHSTRTKSLNVFAAITTMICKASTLLNQLEYIDIGGCMFGDKPGAPSFEEYAKTITTILRSNNINTNTLLLLEPGAALVASPISYVCKVIAIKEIKERRIIFTDGSKKHIAPQMNDIKFAYKLNISNKREIIPNQIISGYSCIEMDRFLSLENEQEMQINDTIEILNCGAYTISLAPLFIEYFPKVIVKDNDTYTIVREEWSTKEFVQKNTIIK